MITERLDRQYNSLLIRGGRIIDPSQGIDATGDLSISGGRIDWLNTEQGTPVPEDCLVLEAEGMVVCPGFIDIHCHLRQPGFEEKETIATGTLAAARGGFTTVCCMPNTNPPIDTRETVEYIRHVADSEGAVRVLPLGCVTRGRAGSELADLGELSISGAVGFSDDGSPVSDPELMRRALEYSRVSGLPIIDHCEDLALSRDGLMNAGPLAERLGFTGIPAAAEESMVSRDIELAKKTDGRIHIAHVSTAGSVDLIRRAKDDGVHITAEVTPHHLTLTEETVVGYNTYGKVNPPLRTTADTEALALGLMEGVIDAVATDHAPHAAEDKVCDFNRAAFGISGFETALGSLMGLVHGGKIDLIMLISKLTYEPASFLKRPDLGTLKPGVLADVTVFDPLKEWLVNPDEFTSKGKNTPLVGQVLRGRVVLTIVAGVVIHSSSPYVFSTGNVR
ncbi:MAG: dihydroorotase [Dehalococcoidia bacterium]|nr:MAG: dihydroorotase [Dehalococcoidia bacterium]